MKRIFVSALFVITFVLSMFGEDPDSLTSRELGEVVVSTRRTGTKRLDTAEDKLNISRTELFRAACCSLGESFTTNPSVDVSYDDAATGARQIKLLGLGGAYVQMLEENIPILRGAASPYGLSYVPGFWMKSIQVSKGSASVKHGPESITGQTNVEYLKPQDKDQIQLNAYFDSQLGAELNVVAGHHLSQRLSSSLLLHWEDDFKQHDSNHDNFADAPKVKQIHGMNRWAYFSPRYIMQARLEYLNEARKSGQLFHHSGAPESHDAIYRTSIITNRWGLWAKNAFIIDPSHNANIAVIASGTLHNQNSTFGRKIYDVDQKSAYLSAIFETEFTHNHTISAGLSLLSDHLDQYGRFTHDVSQVGEKWKETDTRVGAYAEYTFSLGKRLTLLAGLRGDHSSVYGWFATPRAHLRYSPVDGLNIRMSAGKGYRTVHALAENVQIMSSGRTLTIDANLPQEAAWNYGVSIAYDTRLYGKKLSASADYYYTNFKRQVIVDYDTDPTAIRVTALNGKSYSHTWQAELTYHLFRGFTFTGAFRYNDVKATFGGKLRSVPLTNKYKGLATASYSTPLGLWQFDLTAQFNGGGRMPEPLINDDGTPLWGRTFKAFTQISAQITRNFRHWSIYVGGENLTGFKQNNPVINATQPWCSTFDPTLIWGPVHGALIYIGARANI